MNDSLGRRSSMRAPVGPFGPTSKCLVGISCGELTMGFASAPEPSLNSLHPYSARLNTFRFGLMHWANQGLSREHAVRVPAAEHLPDFAERAKLFATKVRHRHDKLGLTERQLIEHTALSRGYIQLLLNNRGGHKDPRTGAYRPPNPTLDVIWRLAEALEVDVAYLVDPDRKVTDDSKR